MESRSEAEKAAGWIPIKERMPTKEEQEQGVEWWHWFMEAAYPGEYRHYDGKWITISMRHWSQEEPLNEFTHWRIATPLKAEGEK